jgi:hypothetical protein
MEETSSENSKDQRQTNTIVTNQTIVLEKDVVNTISRQVMNKYPDHGYTIS